MAYDKVVDSAQLDGAMTSTANAIRAKSGGSGNIPWNAATGFADAVAAIPSSGVVQESDINFYDYDGTLLYAWTLAELAGKTALPELPTQEGLTCQGWNWTLADLQALGHKMNVGAIYITDDGATRLHLNIPTDGVSVNAVFYQSYAQRVSVDWGDGSAAETSGSAALTTMPHTYTSAGKYIVSIMPLRSSMQIIIRLTGRMAAVCEELNIGKNHVGFQAYTWDSAVMALQKISLPASYKYSTQDCLKSLRGTKFLALPSGVPSIGTGDGGAYGTLQRLSIPKSVTEIKDFAFRVNYGLRDFYAPNAACAIGQRVFENCTALSDVVLPASMTEIKFQAFYEGNQIRSLQIPAGVTTIGGGAFFACRRLVSLTLPAGLTTIGASAFASCQSMQYYDFSACTAVPTLDNANAFTGIPSDCEIRVPASLADEWKAATNWATYADHIVGVSTT